MNEIRLREIEKEYTGPTFGPVIQSLIAALRNERVEVKLLKMQVFDEGIATSCLEEENKRLQAVREAAKALKPFLETGSYIPVGHTYEEYKQAVDQLLHAVDLRGD